MKTLLDWALLGVMLSVGGVAAAQDAPPLSTPVSAPVDVAPVLVVGSRIKRTEFTSPSPIQIITVEDAALEGLQDTTMILQQASTAANSSQLNNYYSGYLTNGGPGTNTLSLRGLGDNRTLITLDGRRMGPAGTSGTVGAVDLNTIPDAIIDHVEILKDGASSIYGSDAVAGVVNIVTKKRTDGGDAHIYAKPTERGGGEEYEADASYGRTFEKGYVTVAASIYEQAPLYAGQRKELGCAQDYAFDPATGARLDIVDPATGRYKCQNLPYLNSIIDPIFTGLDWVPSKSAVNGGGFAGLDLTGLHSVGNIYGLDGSYGSPSFGGANPPFNIAASRASMGEFPTSDPRLAHNTAVSPVRRYSVMGTSGYDLDARNSVYLDVFFNRRDSSQDQMGEIFPIISPGNVFNTFNPDNPKYNGYGLNPNIGAPLTAPQVVLLYPEFTQQQVDYERVVIGLRGAIRDYFTLKNWSYDLYYQYSRSAGYYSGSFVYNDRVNATAGSTNAAGCDPNAIAIGGGGKTLAQIEGPGALCQPVNYIAAVMNGGALTPAEQSFLIGTDTGRTIYDYAYVEGSATGDLMDLPAGPLGVAIGFHIRREDIADAPPPNAVANNYYELTSEGATRGADSVREAFAEVRAPLVRNAPFIAALELNASGRYSSYRTSGDALTYKVGLDWKVSDWLRLRATQGSSFRAPALYEHFLAPTSGFVSDQIDPCINYGAGHVSATVAANCAAAGIPSDYGGSHASLAVYTGGGATLRPETSLAKTAGIVLTPHAFGSEVSLAVDYYTYQVRNEISLFGAYGILHACYGATNYPDNPFCSLFTRDPASHDLLAVNDDYVNVASQREQGVDVTAKVSHGLPWGAKIRFDTQLTWTFDTKTGLLGGYTGNFLGTPGQPSFDGNASVRIDRGDWTANWNVAMVGASSAARFTGSQITNYAGLGITANLIVRTPFYMVSNVALRRRYRAWTFEIGVRNMFDVQPPVLSAIGLSTSGSAVLASQYDYYGRSFFMDVSRKF